MTKQTTPKSKTNSLWTQCDSCKAFLPTRDKSAHQCLITFENWSTPFILTDRLYSTIDVKKNEELANGLSESDLHNFVFLSQSVIYLCDFKIGDPVLIRGDGCVPIVRTVWPTVEKNCSSVLFTENGLSQAWEKCSKPTNVIVEAVSQTPEASEIVVTCTNLPKNFDATSELTKRIRSQHLNKIVCEGNFLFILFYGKKLVFSIIDIKTQLEQRIENLSLENKTQFYKIESQTKIHLQNCNKPEFKAPQIKLGGLNAIEDKLTNYIKYYFESKKGDLKIKSVLLFGCSGTGKTTLALNIADKFERNYKTNTEIVGNLSSGDVEDSLKAVFRERKSRTIIIIDDIDLLCPNRLSRPSEQEKRVTSTLIDLLDSITENLFIIATSNKPDAIDSGLRRYGRIDSEIEIPVPNESNRFEIFQCKIPTLPVQELKELATLTPGYVGSDITLVCATTKARSNLTFPELKQTLKEIKPSGMREVQIESPNIHWSDIGGQADLKLKLMQAITWPLTHPECFERMGIRPPRGVLMYGPPGCSKTMIAKALASESKLNFLSIKGPELFNKYVGESERAVRDLFKRARQAAPSIIFFDEIDAIGGERGATGGGNVQERVLAQLLTELDGVTALGAVTVVAATNRPDRIDKALLRPGRLDRIVYVSLPDDQTRSAIIRIKTAKMPLENLNIDYLVEQTKGYSGAEVQAVCNEAALLALEENIKAAVILERHFEKALSLVSPRTPQYLLDIYENYSINFVQK